MRSVGKYMKEQKGRKELVLTNYTSKNLDSLEQGNLESFWA